MRVNKLAMQIETKRLLLRQWRNEDLGQLAEMNHDPRVMEFIGLVLSEDQSKAMMERARKSWEERGYGRFAVEVLETGSVIGFIGLAATRINAHFTPTVEIGWRLSTQHWGRGYATEGADAVMDFSFNNLGLTEVVSFTSAKNLRSRRVMEKVGFQRNPVDDFEHPNLSPDDPLKPNVLYRRSANSKTSLVGTSTSPDARIPTEVA